MTPRFLCDEMLQGLGRWLRAAGYDALIAESGTPDRQLVEQAQHSHRLLITRDRKLLEIKNADKNTILLNANSVPDCLQELTEKLRIDWNHAPFSRCMLCNTPLQKSNKEQRQKAPEDIQNNHTVMLYCPQCDKVYWNGGHVNRMRRKLDAFANGRWH